MTPIWLTKKTCTSYPPCANDSQNDIEESEVDKQNLLEHYIESKKQELYCKHITLRCRYKRWCTQNPSNRDRSTSNDSHIEVNLDPNFNTKDAKSTSYIINSGWIRRNSRITNNSDQRWPFYPITTKITLSVYRKPKDSPKL